MIHSDYVPLHLHTEYSLLDGTIRIPELIEKANAYKMPAVAITDHGNLFGAIEFYKKVSNAGIKPIIGCEIYVAPKSRFDRTKDDKSGAAFHLILLAKNLDGYKNLVTLVTKAYTEGFYYKPRIDKDILEQYSGGLIGLTSCLKGEVPFYLQRDSFDDARESALRYKRIFGPDDFYLELQDNGIPEQYEVNKKLIDLSRELHIKLVATNDSHYIRKEDAIAHDVLLCIQTGKKVNDKDRMKFKTDELYFKSPEEMKASFSEIPEAILNTREIAEKCNLTFKLNHIMLPEYKIEGDLSPDEYLEELAKKGLREKIGSSPGPEYVERFNHEVQIIKNMGFTSYFLIVWDFINHAKSKKIPVGPGRGSAAGSLIAYCLDITEIDPLKYNLLFERFLNPERITMPDIDVDFCKDRRSEVIAYTAQKYGKDHVAQIITFGTMAAKASIRDVGRALGMPYAEVDKIAKLVPNTVNITIKEALGAEPDLRRAYESSEEIKNLMDIAMRLEGLCRHASTHAAGVVISPAPLTDYTSLYKTPSEDALTTQFDMKSIETIGLLKFDFLGLKTLTVLQKTVEYLEEKGIHVDLKDIPFDDKKTYALLSSGETTGIFQLESHGMQDILIKMSPNRFEDLIALVALYRPGPIGSGMIDDFIKRKKGLIPVRYELPQLKEILDETYGVILYQEQVMRIANKLANFTMEQADILRKAMGKKIAHEMERLKDEFVKGAIANKISERKAVKIFDLMALFAKYGFNKSHSAAYAYLAYQTAYLKARYPVEFMAANLSTEENTDKIVKLIRECREMSIDILPPHINLSERQFKITGDAVLFGLEAVKGVGTSAIESLLEARRSDPFASLEDFVSRVDTRKVNKKVMESLIKAGAFDSITQSRAIAMDSLNHLIGGSRSMATLLGQQTFLGAEPLEKNVYEWDEKDLLKYEKQSLGFYITSHPLKNYERELKKINITKTSQLENTSNNGDIKVAGIVSSMKKKQTKDDKGMMASIVLEDDEGSIEVIVFPDLYQKTKSILKKDALLAMKGKLDMTEKGHKLKASEILELNEALERSRIIPSNRSLEKEEIPISPPLKQGDEEAFESAYPISSIYIRLSESNCNHETFLKMRQTFASSKGECPVYLKLHYDYLEVTMATSYKVACDDHFLKEIEYIAGEGSVRSL